jgi:alkyl sulfatase BDS1-like metallo-beta-lactamase superfamily hydrolase
VSPTEGQATTASQDTILAMPIDLLFDFAGVHIIGERAADIDIRINLTFEGSGGDWTMWARRGVLNAREGHADGAQLNIAGPKTALAGVLLEPANAKTVIARAGLKTDGDLDVLDTLASVMDTFDTHFNIATP